MLSAIVSRLVILVFGTLYPAYASYKAVRSKDVKEYVKWMMYWIVFALFTSAETFTDVFLGFWFPFYYEVKVILVFWLLSPMTKGSSFLYRKFVHPMLSKREQDIDEYIARAKDQGYSTVLSLGTKGVNYATAVIMQTAIKGGGGLVNQLRRSYSLGDINMGMDEMGRVQQRANADPDRTDSTGNPESRTQRQRAYSSRTGVEMYFPEVDVDVRQRGSREPSVPLSQIRSTEDVSSGYSSAEPLYARAPTEDPRESLVRTSSVGSARVTRTRTTRATTATPGVKTRAAPTEDSISFDECEESDPDDIDEEFFEVMTPSSPTISLKPITYTVTMHEAMLATPAEVGNNVKLEEILSPTLKTFSDSMLEMYLDNVSNKGDEGQMEGEKMKEHFKEIEGNGVGVIMEVTPKPVEIKVREAAATIENSDKTEDPIVIMTATEIQSEKKQETDSKPIEIDNRVDELSNVPKPVEDIAVPNPTLDETEQDNFEDAEFFGPASEPLSIETLPSESKIKLDRAGKYHKRPAPVPPRRADGETLSPDSDNVSFKSVDSRGSPSPRRELAADDLPPSPREERKTIDVAKNDASKPAPPIGDSPKITTKNLAPGPGPALKPKPEAPPSPNQQKKPKDSPMSRLLSKFFSHEGSSRGLVATSLTNLTAEIEQELRSASSLTFLGPDLPPKLPPKPPKKEAKEEASPSGFRIRDMSHSPPRRKSDI